MMSVYSHDDKIQLDCLMLSTLRSSLGYCYLKKKRRGEGRERKMKKEHIKLANFCCFINFVFTKLAHADKLSPAEWVRLVPIPEMVVR